MNIYLIRSRPGLTVRKIEHAYTCDSDGNVCKLKTVSRSEFRIELTSGFRYANGKGTRAANTWRRCARIGNLGHERIARAILYHNVIVGVILLLEFDQRTVYNPLSRLVRRDT